MRAECKLGRVIQFAELLARVALRTFGAWVGDVAVLVVGVDKPSCALINVAEGGEGEEVQTEEDLDR